MDINSTAGVSTSAQLLKKGAPVLVKYSGEGWFAGFVNSVRRDGKYQIYFNNNEVDIVPQRSPRIKALDKPIKRAKPLSDEEVSKYLNKSETAAPKKRAVTVKPRSAVTVKPVTVTVRGLEFVVTSGLSSKVSHTKQPQYWVNLKNLKTGISIHIDPYFQVQAHSLMGQPISYSWVTPLAMKPFPDMSDQLQPLTLTSGAGQYYLKQLEEFLQDTSNSYWVARKNQIAETFKVEDPSRMLALPIGDTVVKAQLVYIKDFMFISKFTPVFVGHEKFWNLSLFNHQHSISIKYPQFLWQSSSSPSVHYKCPLFSPFVSNVLESEIPSVLEGEASHYVSQLVSMLENPKNKVWVVPAAKKIEILDPTNKLGLKGV